MEKFKFELNGKVFAIDANDKRKAMAYANAYFKDLPTPGTWVPTVTVNSYSWVKGNYFD